MGCIFASRHWAETAEPACFELGRPASHDLFVRPAVPFAEVLFAEVRVDDERSAEADLLGDELGRPAGSNEVGAGYQLQREPERGSLACQGTPGQPRLLNPKPGERRIRPSLPTAGRVPLGLGMSGYEKASHLRQFRRAARSSATLLSGSAAGNLRAMGEVWGNTDAGGDRTRPQDAHLVEAGAAGGAVAGALTVLFFAGARLAAGRSRESYDPAAGGTVAQLVEHLRASYGPEMAAVLPTCAIWVNGLPSAASTTLRPGDEVAVLPPVSGG